MRKMRGNMNMPTPGIQDFILTLRDMLAKLEGDDFTKAWEILTGLRGPDMEDMGDAKGATTAIIRGAVLGKELGMQVGLFARVHPSDSEESRRYRYVIVERAKGGYHWRSHMADAFLSLGLSWSTVNEDFDKYEEEIPGAGHSP